MYDYNFQTKILQTLKSRQESIYFRAPVDPALDHAPDYHEIIALPMDLQTIEKKINKSFGFYREFYNDLNLIWSNAELYNGADSQVTKYARTLDKLVQSMISGLTPNKKHALAGATEKSPAPKRARKDSVQPVDLDPIINVENAIVPIIEPELSFPQKKELCSYIQELNEEQVEDIITLIHTNCPDIFKGVTEKFTILEINLDSFEPSFQTKLLSYVKELLKK